MPIYSHLKKSGGSLLALLLIQGPAALAAEIVPPGGILGAPQAFDVISGSSSASSAQSKTDQEIAEIEKQYFDHDFRSESIDSRLTRIEQLIFGETKLGSDTDRLAVIRKAVKKALTGSQSSLPGAEIVKPDSVRETKSGVDIDLAEGSDSSKIKQTFDGALNSGINNFKLKRYQHAEDDFERAITLNPHSAEAYANLAGALLMLQDKKSASEAFKACYAISPFGKLGAYAREQILKLAQDDAYSKTAPQDTPEMVSTMVRQVNRQAVDRAGIYQSQANITARNRIQLANIEIAKMTAETNLALADLRANRRNRYGGYGNNYDGYGNNYGNRNNRNNNYNDGYNDPYARQEISNANYINTNYIRTDGQVQANVALTQGYNKSQSVFDSATNLKDQILQPVAPGGAKLRALGTNLYARYYGDGMPSTDEPPMVDPPLPALRATAKSLEETRK